MTSTSETFKTALTAHQQGDIETAWAGYQEVIRSDPRHASAISMMGVIQQQIGNLDMADQLLQEALGIDSSDANTLFNLGLVKHLRDETETAEHLFKRSIAKDPKRSDSFNMLGQIAIERGDYKLAIRHLKKALKYQPGFAEAFLNLGHAFHELDRLEEAVKAAQKAADLLPDLAEAHYNLASVYMSAKDYVASEAAFNRALELKPDYLDALTNLVFCLIDSRQPEKAEEAARRAIAMAPDDASANNSMGLVFLRQGKSLEALPYLEKALLARPDDEIATSNLACQYLTLGRLSEGWPLFEKMRKHGMRHGRIFEDGRGISEWHGDDLSGQRILVSGEQGIGEQILFAGMLPDLERNGAQVTYVCDPRLVPLMSRSLPSMSFKPFGEWSLDDPTDFDQYIPAGSLGQFLRPTISDFALQHPFLVADPDLTEELHKKYREGSTRKVIGISWRSASIIVGLDKSVPLDLWGPVFDTPDCRFVSLQYGDPREDVASAHDRHGVDIIIDPDVDALKSIEQCAAQVAACDMVVSISNASLHIAGALGVDSHAIIGRDPNWYWALGDARSAWYPDVRIHRQAVEEPWSDVLARVGQAIKA